MRKFLILSLVAAASAALFFLLPGTPTFDEVQTFLDSDALATSIGKTRISVYSVLKIALSLAALLWVAALISGFGQRQLRSLDSVRQPNREILAKIFQILVYVFAFLIGIEVVGLDFTTLAVVGGAVGIGVGIGLQKIASNFVSGLILLMEGSVRLGDIIEFADGTEGTVRHLGARYTLLESADGRELLIPNDDLVTTRVTSLTHSNREARIEISIGVDYKSDLKKVQHVLLEAALSHPSCSKYRPPSCYLRAFGDSSVKFTLYFWVDNVELGRLEPQSDVLFKIWTAFKAAGIEIPYPHQDLYIKEMPRQAPK